MMHLLRDRYIFVKIRHCTIREKIILYKYTAITSSNLKIQGNVRFRNLCAPGLLYKLNLLYKADFRQLYVICAIMERFRKEGIV